jgi:hypothetical protein
MIIYVSKYSKHNGDTQRFSSAPHTELFKFARACNAMLSERCPEYINDGGLIRVDVMQRANGKMVVNEFESLEACWEGSSDVVNFRVATNLQNYWCTKLNDILEI